jgi:acetyl esterase/lipase
MSQQKMSPYDTVDKADVEGPDMIPLFPKDKVPPPLPEAREAAGALSKQQMIDNVYCHVNATFPGNLYLAQEPSMKPYVLNGTSSRHERHVKPSIKPTVVIFPGGGFGFLAWSREGSSVAEWLNSIGINAFVVKYRVPSDESSQLIDAQRAMSLVRHKAKELGLDPAAPIGAAGFSAGGGLVMDLAKQMARKYAPIGSVDDETFRPDFVLHIYGLCGIEDVTQLRSGTDIPPVFSISASDDPCVPAGQATACCDRLKASGGTCERHVYANGGHGMGACTIYTNKWSGDAACEWTKDAKAWMQKQGFLKTA